MSEDPLDSKITELKAKLLFFDEVKEEAKAAQFDSLKQSLSESIDLIDSLKNNKPKIPNKEEIESIGAMLDVINKVDFATLDKLNQLGGGKAKNI